MKEKTGAWRKALIGIGLVILFILWKLVIAYKDFKETELSYAERGLTIAKEKADLHTIDTTDYYMGGGGYHVYVGKNRSDEAIVVWVQNDQVWHEKLNSGISAEHIITQFKEGEIKRISLGLINGNNNKKRAIWEVFVKTSKGDAYFEMFDFTSGKSLARIQL